MPKLSLLITLALLSGLHADPKKFNLPAETDSYRKGEGMLLAQALCLNCHSTEYCSMQPPLPEKYWDATLKKMVEKFGAPVPPETMPALLKYLVTAYGAPAK